MPIITIDGNIGAGKSTILNYLHSNHNIYVDLEPIDKWKSFLDNIYTNKKNYFNFQVRVWLDRSWIQEKDMNTTIIMERSPYFIRNTFNKYMYNNNLINTQENNIINELYDKTDIIWKSNYFIYIRSNPQKCLERILKRGRDNEKEISIEYLNDIHNLHEETYEKAIENNIKVLCIDIENKSLEEIAELIIKFIKKCKFLSL
jgi:deoxyadenosine/deoxycytidine kinase